MGRTATFEADARGLEAFAYHHEMLVEALKALYRAAPVERFFDYLPQEIVDELQERLEEQDKQNSLFLLAYLEASWRTDFLQRCERKAKDPLSRHLRELRRTKGNKVSFERDLLKAWHESAVMPKRVASEIASAFQFRHWLAHGRHWTPDLQRKYDFAYLYQLALSCQPYFKYL